MGNRGLIAAALAGIALWAWSKQKAEAEGPPASGPSRPAITFTTASASELDQLVAAGYPKGSPEYEEAIDFSYAQVAATLLPGQMVGWTAVKGYHPVTIGSPEYYAAM